MEAIASEAGVSKLTLYSHFKDKEALFCAAVKATCIETRVAKMARESTSRPSWSVPNQCAADGGFNAAAVFEASGSYGTT